MLARASPLSPRRPFGIAGEALGLGCSPARVLFRHILPNAARPLVTQAFLALPVFLLAETALSFLGVGLQEPEASWGGLLTEAADVTPLERPGSWAMFAPAFAITLFVLGARLLGGALEEPSAGPNSVEG